MTHYLVVGAGPIGTAVARQLATRGDTVTVATRSGRGPDLANVNLVRADAADPAQLTDLAAGAEAIFNCVNPDYTRWASDWPPIAASLLSGAQRSGAVLVTCSNLYAYGPTNAKMTADLPLAATGTKGRVRAQMWSDALTAFRRGDARVVEVRGSDYLGPDAESHMGERVISKLTKGKAVSVLADPDQPHSWTYTEDMARTLLAAADTEAAWGTAWHTPVNPPRTQREVVADIAVALGTPIPKIKGLSRKTLSAAGLFVPMIRELKEVYYQFDAPFVLDDTKTRAELGLVPTPWPEIIAAHTQTSRSAQAA